MPSVGGSTWNPDWIDTSGSTHDADAVDSALANAAHMDPATGELIATHITSNPQPALDALRRGQVRIGRFSKFGDIGPGLYASGIPQLWVGRASSKWDFLQRLSRSDRERMHQAALDHPNMTSPSYLSQEEKRVARRDLDQWLEDGVSEWAVLRLGDQPYNMRLWEPKFLKPLGIEPGTQPQLVDVRLRGRFLHAAREPRLRNFTDELVDRLQAAGFAGAFERQGFISTAQIVVWDGRAVRRFGDAYRAA